MYIYSVNYCYLFHYYDMLFKRKCQILFPYFVKYISHNSVWHCFWLLQLILQSKNMVIKVLKHRDFKSLLNYSIKFALFFFFFLCQGSKGMTNTSVYPITFKIGSIFLKGEPCTRQTHYSKHKLTKKGRQTWRSCFPPLEDRVTQSQRCTEACQHRTKLN